MNRQLLQCSFLLNFFHPYCFILNKKAYCYSYHMYLTGFQLYQCYIRFTFFCMSVRPEFGTICPNVIVLRLKAEEDEEAEEEEE